MIKIDGKYESAVIYTDEVEQEALSQIYNLLNQEFSKNSHVRIMSDVHAGAGCVIGYTAKITNQIVPNLIGVDINCGLLGFNLGHKKDLKLKFDKLDNFIRNNIPSGQEVNEEFHEEEILKVWSFISQNDFDSWFDYKKELEKVSKETKQDFNYALQSIGSMGGGNHYLELGETENHELWIVVHSGSRNFGLKVAKFHQQVAEESILGFDKDFFKEKVEEIKKTKKGKGIEVAIQKLRKEMSRKGKATGLEHLEGETSKAYFHDMHIAQIFAELSRYVMIYRIVKNFYGIDFNVDKLLQTNHNYINFNDGIIRKGAVSAHKGEMLFIPMNMAYGTLICRGKGNPEFNYSAPHGAGRLMSRSKAKTNIPIEKFQKVMKNSGVWTTCVNKSTLDESPQAYKRPENVIKHLDPTVEIVSRIVPLYNYKANS